MEQLLEINNMAIILVVAVKAVGAADGLEEVMVAQFIVEVDIGAGRGVKAGEQFADDDQQLECGRFVDEEPFDSKISETIRTM